MDEITGVAVQTLAGQIKISETRQVFWQRGWMYWNLYGLTLFNAELGGVVPDESFSPLQILRFEEGQIIDVTHEYPELVQEDANLWLAAVQNRTIALSDDYLSVRPASPEFLVTLDTYYDFLFLAAYLADMYVLGKEQEGWNIVQEMCQSDHCQLRLFEFGTLERALTVQGYIKQGHGTSLPMKINAEIVK
ncbi:MAG: hypothetical protein H6664_07985 [Ardenticatenaceae bacterium]|nr:hypothetical protein [Ardenticatenaceae bacterium]